jgi:hypothetical protein
MQGEITLNQIAQRGKMKTHVKYVLIVLAVAGCSKAQLPAKDGATQPPSAQVTTTNTAVQKQADQVPLTDDYRKTCKEWAEKFLYKGRSEADVYADVKRRNMHYAYVGFLEMFPTSDHRAEVETLMQGFRIFTPSGTNALAYETLKTKLNYDGVDCVYRWNNFFTGFMASGGGMMRLGTDVNGPESRVPFQSKTGFDLGIGPAVCFGNLQVLDGFIVPTESGLQIKGTVIFPIKP